MDLSKFIKFKENNKRMLCIDFGESFIKIAVLENKQKTYGLLAHGLLEFDAIDKSPEDISHFLKQWLENNSILENEVAFSISDPEAVFIKKLSLPWMPRTELLNAVKWQLKEVLPFNLDDSISDFQVIREHTDRDGAKKVELLCVFAKKEIVNKYIISSFIFNHLFKTFYCKF